MSENELHDPPPGLLAAPLTVKSESGAVVPIPIRPALVIRTHSVNDTAPAMSPLPKRSAWFESQIKAAPTLSLLPLKKLRKREPSELATSLTLAVAVSAERTSILVDVLAVPPPTLPLAAISIELVGAPGRMRKGKRDPLVTSRTKKFASLPATSHVCAVNPPELFCSIRIAGVSVVLTWISNTGVAVPSPTLLLSGA